MRTNRLVSIIILLLDKRRIRAQELADLFEVSPRTIYRDIETICMAGIPVSSSSGVGGGFEITQQFKIDNSVLSTNDLTTILMGISSLSSMVRGDELTHTLTKVKSLIPADRAKEIELHANRLVLDVRPWLGNRSIQPDISIIKSAIQEYRLVSFDYTDRYGNASERTAEPYQLVFKNCQWYWYGYCHTREDFRLFKVSRMNNTQLLDQLFTPLPFKGPLLEIPESVVAQRDSIILRIHSSIKDRVLEFCVEDCAVPDGDDHWLVGFPFIENEYHYSVLFSFGDACECLRPQRIRTEMKRRIHALVAIYDR